MEVVPPGPGQRIKEHALECTVIGIALCRLNDY
jgi:hypothetical protein